MLQFTYIGKLLAAAVLQNNINTRPFWALGSAGSCWCALGLLSWGSPVQGGANALRAARAPGSCGCVSTSSMQLGTDIAGLCPAGHHPHPCSALLAECCRMVPWWGGHCPVPHHPPWTPAGLSSTIKVQFGGNTLPHPFSKHKTVPCEAAEQVWVKSNAVL